MTTTSQELPSLVYNFDFQFTSHPGIWLQMDVRTEEALHVFKTGLLKNHPVSKVKAFSINGDKESVHFVYDVNAAKQGNFPWSLTT